MIGSLEGDIILIKENFVILNTNGVGYKIFLDQNLLREISIDKKYFFWIYQVVKENALELYGFKRYEEVEIFELLLGISGIGPKVAISILSLTNPESLKKAVLTDNIDELTKVSGIGKKNAQKIILELKNKIDKIDLKIDEKNFDLEVYEALEGLGFSGLQIREALKNIPDNLSTEEKIKEALKLIK